MREKIIASAASAALAASMVVCVPGMAFATIDATQSSVAVSTDQVINVTAGSQVDMTGYFKANAVSDDGQYHMDYKVTDGSGASINKHSGLLTATAEGTVTVTAYLTGIAQPQGIKDNPCNSNAVSNSVTVKVNAANAYGYQGVKNTIMITSPSVTAFSGSNEKGWTNTLSASTPTDGYYMFTVKMNNGFKNYNTPALFAARNAGNITLGIGGATVASLNGDNTGEIIIDSVDSDSKTVVVKVAADYVVPGMTELVFGEGFVGNNASNTLGTTVSFVIK